LSAQRYGESTLLAQRVRRKLGSLLGNAAMRTSEGAGRLREAAREMRQSSTLLPQALAARERGNLEAAYFLLQEACHTEPEVLGVASAFWDVSRSLGRGEAASAAAVSLVERCADEGALELGAQYLAELAEAAPDVVVKPVALVRLLPALRERIDKAAQEERAEAEALLRHALGLALDPRNALPGPGLALRLFAEAREVASDTACRAAEIALESPDLHEAKRAMLCEFLGRHRIPRSSKAEGTRPRPAPPHASEPFEPGPELNSGDKSGGCGTWPHAEPVGIAATSAATERPGRMRGVPQELDDDALVVRREDGVASRIRWEEIEAVAVARIETVGRKSVTVIDLVFNWTRRSREALRLLRMRDDSFDPARFASSGEDPLAGFLALILERSCAIPLPDPESALGLRPAVFESLHAYERALLGRSTA
jgi:hypothetical protein